MEASGTPPPGDSPTPSPAPPPPPPPVAPAEEEKATGGWRALGVLLALALAFACAVMIVAMVEISDTPTCEDILSGAAVLEPGEDECFDGSSGQKTVSLVLGFPSGVIAGIAALAALFFAATGRNGRLLLQLTGAAIVLGGLSILIGSI